MSDKFVFLIALQLACFGKEGISICGSIKELSRLFHCNESTCRGVIKLLEQYGLIRIETESSPAAGSLRKVYLPQRDALLKYIGVKCEPKFIMAQIQRCNRVKRSNLYKYYYLILNLYIHDLFEIKPSLSFIEAIFIEGKWFNKLSDIDLICGVRHSQKDECFNFDCNFIVDNLKFFHRPQFLTRRNSVRILSSFLYDCKCVVSANNTLGGTLESVVEDAFPSDSFLYRYINGVSDVNEGIILASKLLGFSGWQLEVLFTHYQEKRICAYLNNYKEHDREGELFRITFYKFIEELNEFSSGDFSKLKKIIDAYIEFTAHDIANKVKGVIERACKNEYNFNGIINPLSIEEECLLISYNQASSIAMIQNKKISNEHLIAFQISVEDNNTRNIILKYI